MLEISFNGKPYQVEEGQTILEAALKCGVDIPYFCYHPCLSRPANCRICVVKVEGWNDLAPACINPVLQGMKVETNCEQVKEARKNVMQFLTLNHPVDCGVCDKSGECLLQDHHFAHNGTPSLSRDEKNHQTKYYDLSDRILLDNERCITCGRCVRFTQEISKSNALGIIKRGDQSLVRRVDEDKPFLDAYSDNIIDICPVGALLSKKFLYKDRVWFLKKTRSVCPGCDRGCNINIWSRKEEWKLHSLEHKNQKIARITPCINPDVNGHWVCNKARDLADHFERPRILKPILNGKNVSLVVALQEIKELIKCSKRIALAISSWASNEELMALKDILITNQNIETYVKDDDLPRANEISEDHILIRRNKNPNRTKAFELFGTKDFPRGENFDLVIVWGEGFSHHLLEHDTKVVQLTSYRDIITERALIVIPLSTMLERDGHYTNGLGVISPFYKVFDPLEDVLHAQDFFKKLFIGDKT